MASPINSFFHSFKQHIDANFSRLPNGPEKIAVKNGPKRIRRLDSLARLLIHKDHTTNCVAIGLINNQWYFTANDNIEELKINIDHILIALSKLKKNDAGKILETSEAREYLFGIYKDMLQRHATNNRLSRTEKDIRKFLTSLKSDDVFTPEEITNLLALQKQFIVVCENNDAVHAEIELISYIKNELYSYDLTLGISKLCCQLCAAAIQAFQQKFMRTIHFRGVHGNFYYKWKPSEFLITDCFEEFVGPNAYDEYRKASNKEEIKEVLKNLHFDRDKIDHIFQASRGAVQLQSNSAPDGSTQQAFDVTERYENIEICDHEDYLAGDSSANKLYSLQAKRGHFDLPHDEIEIHSFHLDEVDDSSSDTEMEQ
ncbi:nucleic acid/nucleotide deaminase domain-containing protein [Rhabdochlamydiaceae symbiont of Dictyostelium giganteum]|uniref:nucleic acid/nucleotide deaminase domain-containing protein n=1 Tax=Rhabdochlamydiaceae symbiont of Dictyostelium giganteum TaxID=3342349 RepID=UPI00384F8E61